MPLPDDGLTTATAIKAYASISDTEDDARLSVIVPAVEAVVRALPVCQEFNTDPATVGWPAAAAPIQLGATMLAARLLRRKDSPDGVAAFGDQGPVYIQRNDPDIALLLKLGDHAKPAIG